MTVLRATAWVVFGVLRRTLREGIVLRSLVFPGGIAVGVSLAALAILAALLPPAVVGVQGPPSEALASLAQEADILLLQVDDAWAAVEEGRVSVATDGKDLFVDLTGAQDLVGESVVREALGTSWRPQPRARRAGAAAAPPRDPPTFFNSLILRIIGVLYCLYGVVFGAGGIARDRAEGLLDATLSLPIPFEVLGFARWFASSLVLSLAYAGTVAVVAAGLYVPDPTAALAHGIAGAATGTALGILAVGQASLDRGFAAPLSIGLTATLVLVGIGAWRVPGSEYLPVATIVGWSHHASALPPLAVALGLGLAATVVFARRTAVA